jgi:hypothetical protein
MYQIPYYMGAVFTPIMGILIDKIGKRPLFLITSSCLITFVDIWYLAMPTSETRDYLVPIIG